ncbi:NAD(P)H dehydrogenase (quinone) [Altererythrobacter atlanticus]|uniref:Quinone oxidoreductase 2 n=1 Tax=Croceibacterium atlanticum TaxID=1267766 RepID=A0A0F7KYC5_9SPHN|nr:SDR family oxidoreductase [Croceibacterium atlanticum]AKH43820.1 Quinone oxidoreductase 2 [Croceibacterium atlanticum]MBB5733730.1 NAD(P)H dehydrogenase (quinone) [Croceibacterium atlanticum]
MTTYAITGATGQLGRLALDELMLKVAPADIVALARDPAKLADYASKGVQVRQGDYDDPASLETALDGVDRVLLISGNAVGERKRQHGNVIDAAKKAGVSYIAYTSILHGDRSKLQLAPEHVATEKLLADSGLNYDLLRNGWYSENYTMGIGQSLETGVILGAAGDGRISSASRADFAAGAAAALVDGKGGSVYELAGDESWTMADFAAELSRQSGKTVEYKDLSEAEYAQVLEGAGLPPPVAAMLASTSALTAAGELHEESKDLSKLAGRPTTPISETIARALR